MKKLIFILSLLVTISVSAQSVKIIKETKSELIINGYDIKDKRENHSFNKVGEVEIFKPEFHTFKGVNYKSVRYIVVWREGMAVTFVEWVSKSGEKILSNYVIK